MRAISIGYHEVAESPSTEPGSRYIITPRCFEEHLAAIEGQRCLPATVDHLSHREVPTLLTFDDGTLSSLTEVGAALERHGWRGHFFVVTDWIGREGFLNAAQIRELHSRGHLIGSHSRSHPERMSALPWCDLLDEWGASCAALGRILGERPTIASVANGYYGPRVARAAAECGIRYLFTSEPWTRVSSVDRCFVLGRYVVQRNTGAAVAARIANDECWPLLWQATTWQIKKALKAVLGERYLSARRYLLSKNTQTV